VKTYRTHIYFKAVASVDVTVPDDNDHKFAEIVAREWVKNLSGPMIDKTVECGGAAVHIEDVQDDVISVDVEEEPYEKEKPE
jgi:hypothetical protein